MPVPRQIDEPISTSGLWHGRPNKRAALSRVIRGQRTSKSHTRPPDPLTVAELLAKASSGGAM